MLKSLQFFGLLTALTLVACGDDSPVSPEARVPKIAFMSDRAGDLELGEFPIYLMETDGTNQVHATTLMKISSVPPAWSPDGTRIAFATSYYDEHTKIYVMDAEGTNLARLFDPSPEVPYWSDWSPAWSPDGKRLAFMSTRDGNFDIYVSEVDGANPVPLTQRPDFDSGFEEFFADLFGTILGGTFFVNFAWSPDGSKIAFHQGEAGNFYIYLMEDDGTNLVNLTDDPADDQWPAWSPDGTKIPFASDRNGNAEVYVMLADGTNPINLTNHPEGDGTPSWSPDGTKIAFGTNRDGNAEIYVMEADGTNPVNLTNHPALDGFPTWVPSIE